MPAYLAKPLPLWRPDQAPAGCLFYALLDEASGLRVRDLAQRAGNGAFVGTPTWGRGLYGPQLGGFTASNYVSVPGLVGAGTLTYPHWAAALFAVTSSTD